MKKILLEKVDKKWIIAMIISICISMIIPSLIGDNIKQCLNDYIYGRGATSDEKIIEPNQIQPINYLVEQNHYVSQTADPQLILGEVNEYVSSVTIYFSEKITSSIQLELFYSTPTEGFTADKLFTATVYEDSNELKIPVCRKVNSLRLDIGTKENVQFSLARIHINEDYQKLSVQKIFTCMKENFGTKMWIERFKIFFLLFLFISIHFLMPIDKLYSFMFNKRWLIAGLFLLFLVINRYHGDSM